MVVVEDGQSGTGVDVPAGDMLVVRLRENPSTGYRWSVEQADELTVEDNGAAGAAEGAGAARLHEFRFRATGPGNHHLRLRHWRDWEGEGSVIARFHLDARFS